MLLFAVILPLCTFTVPVPCTSLRTVASFTRSGDFDETAPVTFGGEVYVRAVVEIKKYTYYGRIFAFTAGSGHAFTVTQDATTGTLRYLGSTDTVYSVVAGTAKVRLGWAFLFEFTITRDSTVSGDGNDALGIMYVDGTEYARGPVALPTRMTRSSNYIGHSHAGNDAPLDGTVSSFLLAQCVPPTPAPPTPAPPTPAPPTPSPPTPAPPTPAPETPAPPTPAPPTPAPPTSAPTPAPPTPSPPTPAPPTPTPPTPAPPTAAPATPAPPTPAPATLAPPTAAADSPVPSSPAPPTAAPVTLSPSTPAPATDAPATPAPATLAAVTTAPATTGPAGTAAPAAATTPAASGTPATLPADTPVPKASSAPAAVPLNDTCLAESQADCEALPLCVWDTAAPQCKASFDCTRVADTLCAQTEGCVWDADAAVCRAAAPRHGSSSSTCALCWVLPVCGAALLPLCAAPFLLFCRKQKPRHRLELETFGQGDLFDAALMEMGGADQAPEEQGNPPGMDDDVTLLE